MQPISVSVTIPSGATGLSSTVVSLGERSIAAIVMPAAWQAAGITFQASAPDGTFYNVYDDAGTEVSVTVAASRVISLDSVAMKLAPLHQIKLRSGTAGVPVDQTTSRTLTLILK